MGTRTAQEQLVVELVGRADKLDAEIARMKQELADLGSKGASSTGNAAKGATDLTDKFGRSARQIAATTEQMARMGTVGVGSIRQLLAQASDMAFFFGPTGAWVGAVGIAGIALAEMLTRARREMEETRKKWEDELTQMVNAGDNAALMRRAADIWVGTPAKNFTDGLAAAHREIQQLQEAMRGASPLDQIAKSAKIHEIQERIKPLEERFRQLRQAILDVNNTPVVIRGLDAVTSTAEAPRSLAQIAGAAKRAQEEVDRYLAALKRLEEAQTDKAMDRITDGLKKTRAQWFAVNEATQRFVDTIKRQLIEIQEKGLIKPAALPKPQEISKGTDEVLKMAQAWSTVGRSIVAAAQGVGQLDAETAATLQNVVTLGDGIAQLMGGNVVGGLAEVLSSVGALFNQASEEQREHLRVIHENTLAIKELTDKASLGGFGGLSGSEAANALSIVQGFLNGTLGTHFERKFSGGGGIRIDAITDPEQWLAVKRAADALGITLDGNVESYQQLASALSRGVPLLGKFGRDFQSLLNMIDSEKVIFGDQGGARGDLAQMMARLAPVSSGIAGIFEDIDLSKTLSPEDIETIRQRVQALFTLMEGGGLTAEQLGELNGAEFLEVLKRIIQDIDELVPELESAADRVHRATSDIDVALALDDVTDPGEVFRRKVHGWIDTVGGSLGELLSSFDLDDLSPENVDRIKESVQNFFQQMQENPDAIDLAGLSFDDLIQILLQFDGVIDDVAASFESAAAKMSRAIAQLERDFDVFGTDALGQVQGYAELFGIDLSGFDFSTKSGVDAAIAAWQDAYRNATDDQSKQYYHTLINAARRIDTGDSAGGSSPRRPSAAESGDLAVTTEIRTITAEQGSRMLGTMVALLATVREFEHGLFERIDQFLAAAVRTVITPPQIPLGLLAAGGGTTTITLTFQQSFYGPVGQVDRAAAAAFADALYDEFSRRLATDVASARLLKGNTIQR